MRRKGCVIEEKNGTFTAKVDLPLVNGKRNQKKRRGFASQVDAWDWIECQLDRVRRGKYFEPTKLKWCEYSKQWLEGKAHTLKGSSYRNYESYLNAHVNSSIGHLRLSDVKLPNILSFIREMSGKMHRDRRLRRNRIKK